MHVTPVITSSLDTKLIENIQQGPFFSYICIVLDSLLDTLRQVQLRSLKEAYK